MAFDFDGTLAPIMARPDDACIAAAVATRLKAPTSRLPVAIVTGRAVADVCERLGFTPQFIIGNHGAEEDTAAVTGDILAGALVKPLGNLRATLRAHADGLQAAGVVVEDKGLSIALHFRQSHHRTRAQQLITDLQTPEPAVLRFLVGKMSVNAMAADAPDKAQAVHALVARLGAAAAFFAGDDVNDEPVFATAPAHSGNFSMTHAKSIVLMAALAALLAACSSTLVTPPTVPAAAMTTAAPAATAQRAATRDQDRGQHRRAWRA